MRMPFFIIGSTIAFVALQFPAFCADMTFRLADPLTADGATPGWIVADGDVTVDTAKALRNFVAAHEGILRFPAASVDQFSSGNVCKGRSLSISPVLQVQI